MSVSDEIKFEPHPDGLVMCDSYDVNRHWNTHQSQDGCVNPRRVGLEVPAEPRFYVPGDYGTIWQFKSCRYGPLSDQYPDGCEHEDCQWWEEWNRARAHLHAIFDGGCTCRHWSCLRCRFFRRFTTYDFCKRHAPESEDCSSCIAEFGLYVKGVHTLAKRFIGPDEGDGNG